MGASKSKDKKTDNNDDMEEEEEEEKEKEKLLSLQDIDKLIKEKDESIKTEFELDFEIWYNILKDHTMKTHLLQLTNKESLAMIANYEYIKDENRTLDEHSQNILNELITKIDTIITENNYSNNGVFIRYSHRSPKDAVFKIEKDKFSAKFKEIALKIWTEDKKLTGYDDKALIINSALRGLVLTASEFQCINSGKTAINVAGHSHRVYRDFKIGDLENGQDFKPFCIIREFYHCLDFESEFRCFIMKNELTVITQYHSLCFVKKLVDNKDKIKDSIINYWAKTVHPLMKKNEIESYVLDVVACINNEDENDEKKEDDDDIDKDYEWMVIELNPMCTNAGACCFEWKKEYKSFLNGPTDFKVRETMYNMTPKQLEDGMDAFSDIVAFLTQQ